MMNYLAVAFGGALGALARFWVYNALANFAGRFPLATFLVNVSGSFLMGIAYVLIIERAQMAPEWRAVITVGFLGAFTTFSTFSMDTLGLLMQGRHGMALAYVLSSLLLCLLGVFLGLGLARLI